ncbi:Uncharacterised protein [Rothia dentocariosa]|uniref:Uncharacterized protein n=1 Tax=Rothia dentocariosa TaxID=2047 RepID=A0A448UT50_9MICC|nr:Uncharacterised protein [Rothia dentocariosa]
MSETPSLKISRVLLVLPLRKTPRRATTTVTLNILMGLGQIIRIAMEDAETT